MSLDLDPGGQHAELAGDDTAKASFEAMYERWYPSLVAYCSRHVWGAEDAEGIAQEAFLRAWLSWDRYSPDRPFWAWLVTIARRLCINRRATYELYTSLPKAGARLLSPPEPGPDEHYELAEQRRLVRTAMDRLKPAERLVVELRDLNGWSYEEIATFQGVSLESVRGSLKRARAALRLAYGRLADGAAAVLGLSWLRRLRERAGPGAVRGQHLGAAVAELGRFGDVLVGLATLSLLAAATGGPAHVDPRPPAPSPTSLEVVAAAAVTATTTTITTTVSPVERDVTQPRRRSGPSAPTSAAAPSPAAMPDLFGERLATPEDAQFQQITPSPDYERDGTVFAVGQGRSCLQRCAMLFRSSDRGATWERLPARNFAAMSIRLSPRFPTDSRIFATGPLGLQVSEDGGATFKTVSPVYGPLAVSPRFAEGDERVLVGAAPGWEYRADLGTTTPITTALLRNVSDMFTITFSDRYDRDQTVFIGSSVATSPVMWSAAVTRCNPTSCEPAVALPGGAGVPPTVLSVLSGTAEPPLLVAWKMDAVFTSRDHGRTFAPTTAPVDGFIHSVFVGPDHEIFLLGSRRTELVTHLFRSSDAGRTWTRVVEGALGSPTVAIALSDGRLLLAPRLGAGGLLCSVDGGASWHRRCPTAA